MIQGKIRNKGFTIIELLVAMAIMAILGGAILSMVMYSSRAYQTSNRSVKLQYEQQLVVTTIRDAILETSRGIWFEEGAEGHPSNLIILSETDDSSGPLVRRFKFVPETETETHALYMSETIVSGSSITIEELIDDSTYTDVSKTNALLSDTVKSFFVNTSEVAKGRVTFDITFEVGEREITVHPEVALRNMIIELDADIDLEEIYKDEPEVFESKVSSVTIMRDGIAFTQNRTDTFSMAGDSTVYDYDAVVTKKKGYTGSFDDTVTWEIDVTTVKEGWEEVIILNPTTGNLALKNTHNKKAKDYTVSGMLILKAISNQDSSRVARVRIRIDENGVYPVSITTLHKKGHGHSDNYDLDYAKKDYESGSLIVNLEHEIEYTSRIEDPANKGSFVTTLTGAGVYEKINYVSVVDENESPLNVAGGGFSSTGNNKGKFVILPSMEGHTYTIIVRASQRNKDGEYVEDHVKIHVHKGAVPKKVTATKTRISGAAEADRGGFYGAIVDWTADVPKMRDSETGEESIVSYICNYEWELDNLNNECHNWSSDAKNNFDQIVKFVKEDAVTIQENTNSKVCVTGEGKNAVRVELLSYLDWNKTYTFRIKVRAKLNPHSGIVNEYMLGYVEDGANYYKYPTREDGLDIFTQNKDEAYTSEIIVTIKPVSVVLKAYPGSLNSLGEGIYSTSTTIGLGEKTRETAGGPYVDKITGIKRNQKIIYDYYKVFRAETEGIVFNSTNYQNVVGKNGGTSNYQGIRMLLNNNNSALVPYYYMEGQHGGLKYWYNQRIKNDGTVEVGNEPGVDPDEADEDTPEEGNGTGNSGALDDSIYRVEPVPGFSANIIAEDEQVYFYLKVAPAEWYKKTSTFPVGCRFECYLEDEYGNNFKAHFGTNGTDNTTDYMNYTVLFKYEGEY